MAPRNESTAKPRKRAVSETSEADSAYISSVNITNYKGIDSLSLEFPSPKLAVDPHVLAFGSRNGLGKTSVLEACAISIYCVVHGDPFDPRNAFSEDALPGDLADLVIRAGAEQAAIQANIHWNGQVYDARITFARNTTPDVSVTPKIRRPAPTQELNAEFLAALFGYSKEAFVKSPLLYFHSYRKVAEGRPELALMLGSGRREYLPGRYRRLAMLNAASQMKLQVLRAKMSQGNLFQGFEDKNAVDVLEIFDILLTEYANGTVGLLKPREDNTIDFRITLRNHSDSFSFDGLSSGQKEIVSTLFMIWNETKDQPSVVLIDEPELHLNPEWQGGFLAKLVEIAPRNQYVIATHSAMIFNSVQDYQRRILESS